MKAPRAGILSSNRSSNAFVVETSAGRRPLTGRSIVFCVGRDGLVIKKYHAYRERSVGQGLARSHSVRPSLLRPSLLSTLRSGQESCLWMAGVRHEGRVKVRRRPTSVAARIIFRVFRGHCQWLPMESLLPCRARPQVTCHVRREGAIMKNIVRSWRRVVGLTILLNSVVALSPVHADPLTFRFSGSIFGVADTDNVFGTVAGDMYTAFLTYDPDLLPGTPVGDSTHYTKAAGETSISLSFSSPGDSFTSDSSFPIEMSVKNTPDFLVTGVAGDGRDSISIEAWFDAVTRFRLVLLESPGSNPLSSNDLPTTTFGGGPGTWNVSELDIDWLSGQFGGQYLRKRLESVRAGQERRATGWCSGAIDYVAMPRERGAGAHSREAERKTASVSPPDVFMRSGEAQSSDVIALATHRRRWCRTSSRRPGRPTQRTTNNRVNEFPANPNSRTFDAAPPWRGFSCDARKPVSRTGTRRKVSRPTNQTVRAPAV